MKQLKIKTMENFFSKNLRIYWFVPVFASSYHELQLLYLSFSSVALFIFNYGPLSFIAKVHSVISLDLNRVYPECVRWHVN